MKESPAMHLIRFFAREQGFRQGRSRERIHAGKEKVVQLAIDYSLEFHAGDFTALAKQNHPSYHDTSIYCAHEWNYAHACGSERGLGNISAAKSFEQWRGRKPFMIADDGAVTPTRIYVGREFVWNGERVKCTSFNDASGSLVACSYKPREGDSYEAKINRRHTITREDLAKQRAAAKENKAAADALLAAKKAGR